MKIILKLNKVLKDYANNPIVDPRNDEEVNAGKLLARQMGNQIGVKEELMIAKFDRWASTLHKGLDLELEKEDFEELKEWVAKKADLSVLTCAPILRMLNDAKDLATKKETKKVGKTK